MSIPKLQNYLLPTINELPVNKVTWQLETQRTALLIHDMQNYFLNFWGENSDLIINVINNIVQIKERCTLLKIPVFYTAQPAKQDDHDRALLNDMWGPGLQLHPEQQYITKKLTPSDDDILLVKWRYSAFHHSELESKLKKLKRDQLIICGVYAHIGCLTTATDAFMRDIQPFMIADAIADFTRDEHMMALRYTSGRSGKVLNTISVLEELAKE